MSETPEGVRLAKRVAALQGCSRREAEILVTAGAVQVEGETVTDPARRVSENAALQIISAAVSGPVTVLLHKPAGVPAAQALRQAWPTLALGPQPAVGLQAFYPLPLHAAGLSVWSDEWPVVRRLLDRERPLEIEWSLTLPMSAAAPVLARLKAGGMRVSLGHERDGVGQWRLVGKGERALGLVDFLDASQSGAPFALRCLRVGRLSLSPLAPGQARLRQDFEKF